MIAHIYRYGDPESVEIETKRVSMLEDGYKFGYANQRILVLGTIPHVHVMLMSQIDWFWIEET
jgi:hypothetical protein